MFKYLQIIFVEIQHPILMNPGHTLQIDLVFSFFFVTIVTICSAQNQSFFLDAQSNYQGCNTLGQVVLYGKDTAQHLTFRMVSNSCNLVNRPLQNSGVFDSLPPCFYVFRAYNQKNDSTDLEVKVGFHIKANLGLKCDTSRIREHFFSIHLFYNQGTSNEAYNNGPGNPPYTIKTKEFGSFTNEFNINTDDTIVYLKYLFNPSADLTLYIYDACGLYDSILVFGLPTINRFYISKTCDQSFDINTLYGAFNFNLPLEGFTYQWFQNDSLVGNEFKVKLSHFDLSDKIRLTMQNGNCIIESNQIASIDTMTSAFQLLIVKDKDILCGSDSTKIKVLNASPQNIVWSTGEVGDSIWVSSPGIYWVKAQNEQGCDDSTIFIIRESNPGITSKVNSNLCFGEAKGSIVLDVNGGIAPISYIWSDSIKSTDRLNLANGSYKVVVSDSIGCQVSDSFMITSPTPMSLTLSAHAADCIPAHNGKVTTMMEGGVPPYTYQWSNGLTLPNVDTLYPGSYTITIFDQNQCSVFFPFRIDDLNPLLGFRRDTICANSTLQVGQSVYNMTGRYVDSLKSFKGCDSVVTTFLIVNEPVDFEFKKKDPTCNGLQDGSLSITAVSGLTDYKIFLNDQLYLPDQLEAIPPGNYVVKLKDYLGCFKEKGFALSNPPLIDFSLGGDRTVAYGDTLSVIPITNLNPSSIKQITWQTTPLQPNCIFCDAIYKYQPVDDHILKATIESITGCKVSNQINISLDRAFKVFVPNIFYPQSVSYTANQYLTVLGGSQVVSINYFRIFNRYGDQMFEAKDFLPNDVSNAWDGRFKGADAPQGVYVYVAEISFADRTVRVVKGDITLVR